MHDQDQSGARPPHSKKLALFGVCLLVFTAHAAAQKKPQTEIAQDSIKTFIEEVRIPITAKDSNGRFDPTVELSDLMLRENGVVQPLKSVYRTRPNVMLLLDTGGELNLAKNVRLTREVAAAFVSSLQADDQIAVMQVNNRVELLQPWTTNYADAVKSLNQLLPAKHNVLLKGLLTAVGEFSKVPPGNNHLVLISDGVDRSGVQPDLDEAYKAVLEANVTLHVISYASLGAKIPPPTPTRSRVKSAVAPELIEALPRTQMKEDPTPDLKTMLKNKGGFVLDIDLLFNRKGIKPALIERTKEFYVVTDETGGNLSLPESAAEMIRQAGEIARDIDSQYVMSYKPLQPFNSSASIEYRRIEVFSRRVGLTIKARRGYVAKNPSKS